MTENLVMFISENLRDCMYSYIVYAKEFLEQRRWKSDEKSIFYKNR